MLKFSKANTKIQALSQVKELEKYLKNKRKVYSFDLLSGWSCPFACDCLSKVHVIDGRKSIKDGPKTKFRCFSASQEVAFPSTYNLRKNNYEEMKGVKKRWDMVEHIEQALPANLGICRIHVGGDFFNEEYFAAWLSIAVRNSDRLFYAYTKSLKFWLSFRDVIPANMVLTASRGGRLDHLIDEHNLRESVVVFSEQEAKERKLEIDHDDSHAANPKKRNKSFALLIHGIQPAGSVASQAIKDLKAANVKFEYGKNTKYKAGV